MREVYNQYDRHPSFGLAGSEFPPLPNTLDCSLPEEFRMFSVLMWQIILSDLLPVFDLVGFYPTNNHDGKLANLLTINLSLSSCEEDNLYPAFIPQGYLFQIRRYVQIYYSPVREAFSVIRRYRQKLSTCMSNSNQ